MKTYKETVMALLVKSDVSDNLGMKLKMNPQTFYIKSKSIFNPTKAYQLWNYF